MTVHSRFEKLIKLIWAAALEKSHGYSGKISLTLKFTVVIRNKFFRADAQKWLASGSNRPILLKNSFLGGEEKFLASVTSLNNFYTRGYMKNLNSRYRSSHRLLCRDWIGSLVIIKSSRNLPLFIFGVFQQNRSKIASWPGFLSVSFRESSQSHATSPAISTKPA